MADPQQRINPSVGERFPFRTANVSNVINGYLVYPHWHDQLEFIKVMDGNVLVTLDNQTFTAEQDDIIYVNSEQIHSVKPKTANARIMGIIFDKFFITNFMEGFETKQIYKLFINIKQRQSLFAPSHPLWGELNAAIQASYEENERRDIYYEMAIKSCIYRMMTAILRYFDKQGSTEKSGNTSLAINHFVAIRPVLDHIEEHYAESIYLVDLCRLVSMSPYHFSRTFKKLIGMTIPDYINLTRINMAKKMLMDSDLSITEIAEKVGFCNMHYFGKVFKNTTGVSALHFRNEINKQVLS
ncbi:AraC family transcriptional regulator [Paenibacillus eucommiae]|uniref:AraC-like DNA-binding protein n=1 Tax=Paenibacillus eucommiae TaxID=1355755 RepID=A0ABS4IW92_9BACL|nr:AraC family transcriptional regulator [Paenibacillus eucommiae]MBP1991863.1 AraC-like DNA-binding protein [Paenibacillus eucommiae]